MSRTSDPPWFGDPPIVTFRDGTFYFLCLTAVRRLSNKQFYAILRVECTRRWFMIACRVALGSLALSNKALFVFTSQSYHDHNRD